MFSVKGTLEVVDEIVHVSDRFSKRKIKVSVTDKEYTNTFTMDVIGKAVDAFETYHIEEGDIVEIGFNIKQREYKEKIYTDLSAYKVFKCK